MTVKVYFWRPGLLKSSGLSAFLLRDVGHVSIEINNNYISHRPSLENNNNTQTHLIEYALQYAFLSESINNDDDDDIKSLSLTDHNKTSNKDYSKKYVTLNAVESAAKTNFNYYQECSAKGRSADRVIVIPNLNEYKMLEYYKTQQRSMYHPISNNCSTFVANVIRSSLNCSSKLCSYCSLRYEDENPLSYIKSIITNPLFNATEAITNTGGFREFILQTFGISDKSFRVWTPSLIEEFIELLLMNSSNKCLGNKFNMIDSVIDIFDGLF
ncbi:hypothetical protein H6G33_36425 [Calothrix sp. FACHB-1219]|uniref:hypothetical protein n=1 Tax=unclassified Calothrix TaxID=2619626 RepID=UPI0016844682|nr:MULTISPECIES: hypothetical protein [unclassified Calothrix]MBD2207846.1 hypothetical protein [Calothrix sp. FACHB-168]MBD2222419.1 hypothetical protein [Calothrix sp. FACHB-1219]